jgi:DNA gyrase subunit A
MVYKLKVYRLPLGTPQSRGKAWVNLLPLGDGETISTLMPLPEDESSWDAMSVMFATSTGDVRRNQLSDFANVKTNGKIAMKLAPGERLVGVETCRADQDVLLATAGGKGIRFSVDDVRVFFSRSSTGVRGIRLAKGDAVISLSILRHVEATPEERIAYVQLANARRRAGGEAEPDATEPSEPGVEGAEILSPERFAELEAAEELLLTVTANGFGKRTSAHEYRITNRGGQGIANIDTSERNGPVVASFPVAPRDQIMLVTDGGQLIRCPVHDIRVAGRRTQGVVLFKVGEGETVVSVSRLDVADDAGAEESGAGETSAAEDGDA